MTKHTFQGRTTLIHQLHQQNPNSFHIRSTTRSICNKTPLPPEVTRALTHSKDQNPNLIVKVKNHTNELPNRKSPNSQHTNLEAKNKKQKIAAVEPDTDCDQTRAILQFSVQNPQKKISNSEIKLVKLVKQ